MDHHDDSAREFLRHAVATLAYRAEKALREAPPRFSFLRAAPDARTAGEILAHMGDLMDWALYLAKGQHVWRDSTPRGWRDDVERFFEALRAFDTFVSSDVTLGALPEKLFQGPVADALTHVGQIALLRRMAGAPVRGENYFRAEIVPGRVGTDQTRRRVEFD